ncbi:MAG TPA: globin [Acidimicrobiales bacterium]|nr:globin [Acidimicrobiales bacterium]
MSSIFERLGGEQFFTELVGGFYARIETDPVLRPMYPEELDPAKRRLRLFLMQYFGGPTAYDEERGHPRLRLRHMGFVIDQRARDIWLSHMLASLEELLSTARLPISKEDEHALRVYLDETSQFLVNHGGLSILR